SRTRHQRGPAACRATPARRHGALPRSHACAGASTRACSRTHAGNTARGPGPKILVTPRIDLNCDLGEGAGHDAELMPLITSANIACGVHAGDAATMRATVALAQQHGVAIGAHPGFADREHFGRQEMNLPAAELRELMRSQIEVLRALGPVRH